jgi:tetratricopeptide (TPR) repeat protein
MQQVQADAAASGSPSVLIDAKLNLGIAYNRIGRRSEALEQYQAAEDIYRLQRLDNPLLVARIDRLMAIELANLDRDAEALDRIEHAYQVLLAESGPLSQELADCLDVYLVLLNALGRAEEGLTITGPSYQALPDAKQLPTLRRAQIMASHAYALKLAGQAAAAEGAIRTSIALRESLFGADAVELTSSMSKLIAVLRDQRRYGEAALLADRALAIRREHLPAAHPSIAFAASNAARAWLEAGAAARGRPAIDEALAIYQQSGRLRTAAGLSAQLTRAEILRALNDRPGADAALADLAPELERLDPAGRLRLRELLEGHGNTP